MTSPYFAPRGGLPAQTALTTDRAVFTDAYAVLPARTMSDTTTSYLPFWTRPGCGSSPSRPAASSRDV